MTEDQIERTVERQMDRLDRQLMAGTINQTDYDRCVEVIDEWATEAHMALALGAQA